MVRAVTPIPFVKARFFDRCGKPLTGGQIYTYEANTTTPKVTYKDPYGLTPNTNPIILDAAGEADIYLDGTYRIRITDRNDVLVNDVAKIGSWFSDNLQDTLDNISGAMDEALKPVLQNLDETINAAAAAAAGANGWTDMLIDTGNGRNQHDKNNDIIHVKDFGAKGDGVTDDTVALQNALNAAKGKILIFDNKTYNVNSSLQPRNVAMFVNGATINLTTASHYAIIFGDNTKAIGDLYVTVNSGSRGARVIGNNVSIDSIVITAINGSDTYGFYICNNTPSSPETPIKNFYAKNISVNNFLAACQFFNIESSHIGNFRCKNYRTGFYLRDAKNSTIDYIECVKMWATADGGAGQNGVLFESTYANNSIYNVKIGKIHVEDSPEHGVRFGGTYSITGVNIDSIYTKNTGASSTSTGGSGVKILGGNYGRPQYNYHFDININTITSIDCQVNTGVNNFAALAISHAKNITVGQHTVRKVSNPTYSCRRALHLACCENITIRSQDYKDLNINGVIFYEGEISDMLDYDIIKNVYMPNYNCVHSIASSGASLYFNATTTKISDIVISGYLVSDLYVRSEAQSSGTTNNVYITLKAKPLSTDLTGKAPPIITPNTVNGFIINLVSPFFGSYGSTASNGSTFTDPAATNPFYVRVGGIWKSVATL